MTRLGSLISVTSSTLHWTIPIGIETAALYSIHVTFSRIVLLEKVNKENILLGFLDVSGKQMSGGTYKYSPPTPVSHYRLPLPPSKRVGPPKNLFNHILQITHIRVPPSKIDSIPSLTLSSR